MSDYQTDVAILKFREIWIVHKISCHVSGICMQSQIKVSILNLTNLKFAGIHVFASGR